MTLLAVGENLEDASSISIPLSNAIKTEPGYAFKHISEGDGDNLACMLHGSNGTLFLMKSFRDQVHIPPWLESKNYVLCKM